MATQVRIADDCVLYNSPALLFVDNPDPLLDELKRQLDEAQAQSPVVRCTVEGLGTSCRVVSAVGEFHPARLTALLRLGEKGCYYVRSLSWPMH